MRTITDKHTENFKIHLCDEEKSANTVKKYMRDIRCFTQWLNGKSIDKPAVLEYKKALCGKYSPKSVNSMLSSLNTFFMFCGWYELKVKTLKIQRQIFADKSKELAKDEYSRLLAAAQGNKRLYYLMQTLASTGLRVSELKYVTCEAVNSGRATINCKGKIRCVFLPGKLCKMLRAYIKSKNIKCGSVFVTVNGNPIDRSNIWKMLKSLCTAAGVAKEKVFPHNFRHLFARTYYKVQKDIVRLADILGHSSVDTTRIYTMENGDICRRQIQKLGLLKC